MIRKNHAWKWRRRVIRGALIAGAFLLFLTDDPLIVAAPDSCGFELVEQKGNPLYPYKITKKGSFVAYVTIKERGSDQMISIGGQFFTYDPATGKMARAQKRLSQKAKSLEDAVRIAVAVWSKEHCNYGN